MAAGVADQGRRCGHGMSPGAAPRVVCRRRAGGRGQGRRLQRTARTCGRSAHLGIRAAMENMPVIRPFRWEMLNPETAPVSRSKTGAFHGGAGKVNIWSIKRRFPGGDGTGVAILRSGRHNGRRRRRRDHSWPHRLSDRGAPHDPAAARRRHLDAAVGPGRGGPVPAAARAQHVEPRLRATPAPSASRPPHPARTPSSEPSRRPRSSVCAFRTQTADGGSRMVSIVTVWTRRDQTLGVRRAEMSVLGLCGQAVAITRGVEANPAPASVASSDACHRPSAVQRGRSRWATPKARWHVRGGVGRRCARRWACTRVTRCRDLLPAAGHRPGTTRWC